MLGHGRLEKHEKDAKKKKGKVKKLEAELKAKNDALASAHADLVKYKDKRENLINAYITSPDFQELMTKHEKGIYLLSSQLAEIRASEL